MIAVPVVKSAAGNVIEMVAVRRHRVATAIVAAVTGRRRANYHWGNDWFILPNPVYGEWQRLCGDNPRGKLKVTAMKQIGQFNANH